MNVKALGIFIGTVRFGVLFQYVQTGGQTTNRFVADHDAHTIRQVLSDSYLAENPAEQAAFWAAITSAPLNGALSKDRQSWLLPAFFQNLLPEGVFRDHVASQRQCAPDDHFELLAACGKDLPGNVYARTVVLDRSEIAELVTQGNDSLEMTVTAEPMDDGMSISGVQPKLGVTLVGDRYVGRTKDQDTHIIAKLPVGGSAFLPEVEDLSLRLAAAAGVNTCKAYLAPLSKLAAEHDYVLGPDELKSDFLAVQRFDRAPGVRTHCEDFAQVLGIQPEYKYSTDVSYLTIAAVMKGKPSLGVPAVHELLRRILVNEMLGNPDMHLKNIGLIYRNGITPELSPAYDIVSHCVYNGARGHGLLLLPLELMDKFITKDMVGQSKKRMLLGPGIVRAFCEALDIAEKPVTKVLTECAKNALAKWPALVNTSGLSALQKRMLLAHFHSHSAIVGLEKRETRSTPKAV